MHLWSLQNSHSSPLLKGFCIKIAGVPTTLLRELCHRQLFGILKFFFRIATFQNFGQLLRISPEIIMSLLSLSFKMYFKFLFIHIIKLTCVFRYPLTKNYLKVLKSQNIDFRIMLSYEINLTTYVGYLKDVSIWVNL